MSEGIKAHSRYFGNPNWMMGYFNYVHRDPAFRERWTAALGDVTDKVVVEIGCGLAMSFQRLESAQGSDRRRCRRRRAGAGARDGL